MIIEYNRCCGCGACNNACPVNAIKMVADKEGFLYPHIDSSWCLDCRKCQRVCPIINIDSFQLAEHNIAVYAGYFTNEEKLKASASGGAATAIAEKFIRHGGVVFGVEYCDGYKAARFTSARTIDELARLKGSKYIQSRKEDVYKKLKKLLDAGEQALFIGLPCEVGAVKSFLHKDYANLYTVELICHGVTSPKVAEKYIEELEEKFNSKIVDFTVRYKARGWTPPYIRALFANKRTFTKEFYKTSYGIAFSEMSRPSCYTCVYKGDKRVGDITVGDYWGITDKDFCWNKNGVSIVCLHTQKGQELFDSIPDYCVFAADYERAANSNQRMVLPKADSGRREQFSDIFVNQSLNYACKKIIPAKTKIKKKLSEAMWRAFNFAKRVFSK